MRSEETDFKYDVFLSHNAKDKPRVRRLAERLKQAGLRVWFDEWNIKSGDIIALKVDEGLEQSRVLLLCISPNALASGWVALERSTAVHRDPSNSDRHLIPVLLADCELPDTLRRYKYVDYRGESNNAISELLNGCKPSAERPNQVASKSSRRVTSDDTRSLRPTPQSAQVIAVHLLHEFRRELGGLLEAWNSSQDVFTFNPVRPPRELEAALLSAEPIEAHKAAELAIRIRENGGFERSDGIIQFCEGRLYTDRYHQLYSWTTWRKQRRFESSTISLFMKRNLASENPEGASLFAMIVQSMLYALGLA